MRTVLAILVAGAALTFAVDSAAAAVLRTEPGAELSAGPLFTGGSVAWQEERCVSGCDPEEVDCNQSYRSVLRLAPPGRAPGTEADALGGCASSGPEGGSSDTSYRLSPGWVASLTSTSTTSDADGQTGGVTLSVGRRGRQLRPLVDCGTEADDVAPSINAEFDLEGDTLVYEPRPCDTATSVAIRNLETGAQREISFPDAKELVAITATGDRAAVATDSAIRVLDTRTGATVLTTGYGPRRLSGLRVGGGGRIAFTYESSCGQGFWTAEPGRPVARLVAPGACGPGVPSGTGFVYRAEGGGGSLRFYDDRNGRSRPVVDFGGIQAAAGVDAAGGRVVYALRACDGGYDIRTARLAGSRKSESGRCPVRRARPGLVGRRDGRLRARLRCTRGCAGSLQVRLGRRLTASRYFALPAGRRVQAVTVLLGRQTRAALRRGLEPRRLRIRVVTGDRARAASRMGVRRYARLPSPRAVRRLPGGRSAHQLDLNVRVQLPGRSPRPACVERAETVDEKTGLPYSSDEEDGADAACLRRRTLGVRAGRSLLVRTQPEARSLVATLAGRRLPCRRVRAGRWRCRITGRPGRGRLRMATAYVEARAVSELELAVR